jgi:transcriptional regulator with XRE-family HTH domain
MILSENIKKFRKDAGLTQKALASKSGLSFSMVSKLETGEQSNPSFETIRKIAVVLKISPGDLVNAPVTIEDQIDEYIEFKRGLKIPESIIKTVEYDEPCADLNFRKKMQAINNIPMSAFNGRDEYREYLDKRPELKKLIYLLKNSTKAEIEQITSLVETFKGI